jgi:hypothetical protein
MASPSAHLLASMSTIADFDRIPTSQALVLVTAGQPFPSDEESRREQVKTRNLGGNMRFLVGVLDIFSSTSHFEGSIRCMFCLQKP